jgi:hypothetical protein
LKAHENTSKFLALIQTNLICSFSVSVGKRAFWSSRLDLYLFSYVQQKLFLNWVIKMVDHSCLPALLDIFHTSMCTHQQFQIVWMKALKAKELHQLQNQSDPIAWSIVPSSMLPKCDGTILLHVL